jgi:hypothetical protein
MDNFKIFLQQMWEKNHIIHKEKWDPFKNNNKDMNYFQLIIVIVKQKKRN